MTGSASMGSDAIDSISLKGHDFWPLHGQVLYQDENGSGRAERLLPLVDELLAQCGVSKQAIGAIAFSQGPGAFTGLRIACGFAQGLGLGLGVPVIPVTALRATAQLALDGLMHQSEVEADYIVTILDARMDEVYAAVYAMPPYVHNNVHNNEPMPPMAGATSPESAVELGAQDKVRENVRSHAAPVPLQWIQRHDPLTLVQGPHLIAARDMVHWLNQVPAYHNKRMLLCGDGLSLYGDIIDASVATTDLAFKLIPSEYRQWPDAMVLGRIAYAQWQRGEVLAPRFAAPIYLRDKVAFTEAERATGLKGNPKAQLPDPSVMASIRSQREAAVDVEAKASLADPLAAVVASLAADAAPLAPVAAPLAPVAALRVNDPIATISWTAQGHRYVIQPMQQDDLPQVLQIEQRVQSHPWSQGNFEDSLAAGYPAWVVVSHAVDGESSSPEVVGFAVQMLAPDVAHLLLIGVKPELQGQGIGRRLMQQLEANALQQGLDKQLLEVRQANEQAIAFYQQLDYQRIGTRKGYYRGVAGQSEDALVLEKVLSHA